jgi:hypothetical protein
MFDPRNQCDLVLQHSASPKASQIMVTYKQIYTLINVCNCRPTHKHTQMRTHTHIYWESIISDTSCRPKT